MHIGILNETKVPPDRRVPLTPAQALSLEDQYPGVKVTVEPSGVRAYTDGEYRQLGIEVGNDLSACQVLLGIKEVHIPTILPGKTYYFFSHTAKKQAYNRPLLKEMVKQGNTLVDYEYLTDRDGRRLVAFGRWAGIVGAYKGLRAWGIRSGEYSLPPAGTFNDLEEMLKEVGRMDLSPVKILITGGGRVAMGAMETLAPLKLLQVTPGDFLTREFDRPVFCQIDPGDYVRHRKAKEFSLEHFFNHPDEYESTFKRYSYATDIYLACHYWDLRSPVFLVPDDYRDPRFRIRVIADISCDIRLPIASTLRPSTNDDPFYGYNPATEAEDEPFLPRVVTVMSVDNLPGELPRNASDDFGKNLLSEVMPALLTGDRDGIIERATILKEGKLTANFSYLQGFLDGTE